MGGLLVVFHFRLVDPLVNLRIVFPIQYVGLPLSTQALEAQYLWLHTIFKSSDGKYLSPVSHYDPRLIRHKICRFFCWGIEHVVWRKSYRQWRWLRYRWQRCQWYSFQVCARVYSISNKRYSGADTLSPLCYDRNTYCEGGHGLSIGSLGKGGQVSSVQNVLWVFFSLPSVWYHAQ